MNCPSCENPIPYNSTVCEWCGNKHAGNIIKTNAEIIVNCYKCNNLIDIQSSECECCNAPISLDKYNMTVIKSPIDGIIFLSSGPDEPAFVNVDDYVSTGKLIYILESDRLFLEIESEVSGRIAKILVSNASFIEVNQPLFIVNQSKSNNSNCPNCKNPIQVNSTECEWCGNVINNINLGWNGDTFALYGIDLDAELLQLLKNNRNEDALNYLKDKSNLDLMESLKYLDKLARKNGLGKKAACFIATACYGDYECAEVKEFRIYRDNVLLKHKIGRLFVEFYYYFSPPIATLISKSEFSKRIIRTLFLRPILNLIKK